MELMPQIKNDLEKFLARNNLSGTIIGEQVMIQTPTPNPRKRMHVKYYRDAAISLEFEAPYGDGSSLYKVVIEYMAPLL